MEEIRVLIVEDSEDDAYLVERQLRRHGFTAHCRRVDTADEMRSALAERHWDLVISDYLLPEFNAIGAMQLYRESGLDIPFIVISGSIGEQVAVEAMKNGVHDYMMKENLSRLGVTVERELREARNRREKRELTGGLSTRLRELLLAIKRSSEESLGHDTTAPVRESLERIDRAATEALATIESIRGKAEHARAE